MLFGPGGHVRARLVYNTAGHTLPTLAKMAVVHCCPFCDLDWRHKGERGELTETAKRSIGHMADDRMIEQSPGSRPCGGIVCWLKGD